MPREGRGSMPCRGGGEGAMSLRRTRLRAEPKMAGAAGREGGDTAPEGPPGRPALLLRPPSAPAGLLPPRWGGGKGRRDGQAVRGRGRASLSPRRHSPAGSRGGRAVGRGRRCRAGSPAPRWPPSRRVQRPAGGDGGGGGRGKGGRAEEEGQRRAQPLPAGLGAAGRAGSGFTPETGAQSGLVALTY